MAMAEAALPGSVTSIEDEQSSQVLPRQMSQHLSLHNSSPPPKTDEIASSTLQTEFVDMNPSKPSTFVMSADTDEGIAKTIKQYKKLAVAASLISAVQIVFF